MMEISDIYFENNSCVHEIAVYDALILNFSNLIIFKHNLAGTSFGDSALLLSGIKDVYASNFLVIDSFGLKTTSVFKMIDNKLNKKPDNVKILLFFEKKIRIASNKFLKIY